MRAGKARLLHQATLTPSTRHQVLLPSTRCICAFSTTCKSGQHDQPPADANVSYYDRLWAGLTPGISNVKITSTGRKHSPTSTSNSSRVSQPPSSSSRSIPSSSSKPRPSWMSDKSPLDRPSFRTPSDDGDGGKKATSHFSAMTGFQGKNTSSGVSQSNSRSSRPPFSSTESESNASQTPESDKPVANSGEGVSWADLLSKIQKTRGGDYPSLPTNYHYHDPTPRVQRPAYQSPSNNSSWTARGADNTTSQQRLHPVTSGHSASSKQIPHVDNALHEKIFDSQTESRRYSFTLQEEIRYLSSPAQALKWMQDRLFSKTNEDSLMYKLDNTQSNNGISGNNEELLYLYGDLLVDVTHYLRTSSTASHSVTPSSSSPSSATRQMAFLPLMLAKEHSTKSYLYGCTPKLYALNIRMKWEDFGDIQGVLELLQEMERGAVHLNMAIQDYIKNISLAVMADRLRAQRLVEDEGERVALTFSESREHIEAVPQSAGEEASNSEEAGVTIINESTEKASSQHPFASKFIIEKAIESKLFFSNAQRRALREIERIVVEDRKKYFEYRDREDNLNDNIISRSSNTSRFASQNEGDFNKMMGNEGEGEGEGQMSEVNALIESYGRAVPLLSSMIAPSSGQHAQGYDPHERSNRASSYRDSDHHSRPASSPDDTDIPSDSNNPGMNESFDILNEAVSEASIAKPKKIRKTPVKSAWSKKRKDTFVNAGKEAAVRGSSEAKL